LTNRGGMVAAVLLAEVALRIIDRKPQWYLKCSLERARWSSGADFEIDAQLGYEPILGPGHPYNSY